MVDEEIAITKDIIRPEPKDFTPTFSEWIADNGIQIIESKRGGTPSVIYRIPENHTLFITSAFIAVIDQIDQSAHGHAQIQIENIAAGLFKTILSAAIDHHTTASPTVGNNSISFISPLKVEAPFRIATNATGISNSATVEGGITGFLLPKKISIR